jgi:Tfp pilus assembly protein PilP
VRDFLGAFVLLAAASVALADQAPAAANPASPPALPAAPAAGPPPVDPFVYQPDGRRDPFVSLLGVGSEKGPAVRRGDGAAGLMVEELAVRGVLQSRGTLIAMVQGPDNKTYLIHQGDKLADGVVKNVTPQGLVVIQDVHDPLSTVKQREVRRLLRSLEDAKQ